MVVYECKYCDVKELVLDEALDQQPKIDWEDAFEAWMVDLVEQPNVFDTPIKVVVLVFL